MPTLDEAVRDFLAQPRLAVAGLSRDPNATANLIYRRLKATGHTVFGTNPRAQEAEGERCYPNLRSIPGGVDGVLIATPPAAALEIVRECHDLGIRRVWMHRAFGAGSVSAEAVRFGREHAMTVIGGACPLMYCGAVDPFHRGLRAVMGWFGGLPRVA